MRRRVILHGHLAAAAGGIGEWTLDVATAPEALRAIEAQRPGVLARILADHRSGIDYAVIAGDESLGEADLMHPLGSRRTLEFVPLAAGSGSDNPVIQIIAGVVLVAAVAALPYLAPSWFAAGGFFAEGTFALSALYFVGAIGVSMALGGIAGLISGTPKTLSTDKATTESANDVPSYHFAGQVNLTGHGQPMPVGYGRMIVGSRRISLGIRTERTL